MVSKITEPGIGQTELWTPAELHTPNFEDLEIPENQVISMSRLLRAVSNAIGLPTSFVTEAEFAAARPAAMYQHLYIDRDDIRSKTAENLFMGVVHPTREFSDISRSPREIARQVKSRTRKSFTLEDVAIDGISGVRVTDNEGNEVDRDEIDQRVQRAAGHTLKGFAEKLTVQRQKLSEQYRALDALDKELASPGRAHYKAINLDRLRRTGEHAIRQAIEIASINADWSSLTVDGLHKAAMYRIYGLPGHNNARLANFRPWTILTKNWTKARHHNVSRAFGNAQKELTNYQLALDAKELA